MKSFDHKSQLIEAIVFDFGGVLLDINYQKTIDALAKEIQIDPNNFALTATHENIFTSFEKGESKVETFLWQLQRLAKTKIPHPRPLIDAWNAMLIGWQPYKFDLLLQLKKKYKVYLLSNINEIHLEWVHNDLKKIHGITNFESKFFDHVFYSHQIGLRKPDINCFAYTQDIIQLEKSKVLFIDDLQQNIEAASEFGWNVYKYNSIDNLKNILSNNFNIQ